MSLTLEQKLKEEEFFSVKYHFPQRQNASYMDECIYCKKEFDASNCKCCEKCNYKITKACDIYQLLCENKLPNILPKEMWMLIIIKILPENYLES